MTAATARANCADATEADRALLPAPGSRDEARRLAERYCRSCPVFAWCASEQQRMQSPGVWAGQWWMASHNNQAKSRTAGIDLLTREAS